MVNEKFITFTSELKEKRKIADKTVERGEYL